mgnify:CR=1 FL=1
MGFSVFDWEKKDLGFVIVVLISILGVSYFQLKISQAKTRDSQRKSDVELVGKAINAFFEDYKILPAASGKGEIISCGDGGIAVCQWGEGPIVDKENVTYLKKLPVDPQANKGLSYIYSTNPERTKYKLCITLEYKADKDYRVDVQCNWYAHN